MFFERNQVTGNRVTRHFFRPRQIRAIRNASWKRRDDNRKSFLGFGAENYAKLFNFRFHSSDGSTNSVHIATFYLPELYNNLTSDGLNALLYTRTSSIEP